MDQESNSVRNSPIFYILGSLLLKIKLPIALLKFLSVIIALLICLIFYKCLVIKYGNKNNATYEDMKRLIDFVKNNVKEKTGVTLDLEIEIIG